MIALEHGSVQTLAGDARRAVDELAAEIRGIDRRLSLGAVEIGCKLLEVRELLKPTGHWRAWCQETLGWPDNTVSRYVRVARRFAECRAGVLEHIAFCGLHRLAEKATPAAAVAEAMERAAAGEYLTVAAVHAIIRGHSPPGGEASEPSPRDVLREKVMAIARRWPPEQLEELARHLAAIAAELVTKRRGPRKHFRA